MFRINALCFSVVILLFLSLAGCAGTSGGSGQAPAPSAAAPTPTGEAKTQTDQKIWSYYSSDMQAFADRFTENEIRSVTYRNASEGGLVSYTLTDPEIIRAVFDALDQITVGEETEIFATDSDDGFEFLTDQAESFSVSFNMHNLNVGKKLYLVSGDAGLWKLTRRITEEYVPDGWEAPGDAFKLAQSSVGNFRFFYSAAYQMEEDENGTITICFDDQKNPQQYIRVGRTTGPDAVEFLEEKVYEAQMTSPDIQDIEPEEPALLDITERDVYGVYIAYGSGEETDSTQAWLAENYADGSMVWYEVRFRSEKEDESETATRTILETIELDDWSGQSQGGTESAEVFMEGRWSWTVETLPDGNTEYCFDDLLIVDIPEDWEGKYLTEAHDNYFSFYHVGSYNKFMEEYGTAGGHLFTVAWYTDKEYENLPNYRYLGLAPEGYYVMILPTDVQGWMDDDSIREEWMSLQEGMDYVESNAMSMLMI